MSLVYADRGRSNTGPQADAARSPVDQHAGMARFPHRFGRRRERSSPILLPSFVVAMLAVVVAIVVIGRTGSDLATIGAVAVLLLATGVMMVAIAKPLGEQPPSDGPGDREDGS